jgi:hypothetical protein
MAQDNEGYILYRAGYPEHKIRRIYARKSHSVSHHAFMYKNEASSSRQSTHVKLPKKKTPTVSNEPNVSFKTFDASYMLTNKSGKVVAKYVGDKHKGSRTCVWVPKVLVSNVKGPKTVWVPKKTRPAGGKTAPGHFNKKKTFSRRSRKPPNPCPTHTQRLCFGVGQTRGFF